MTASTTTPLLRWDLTLINDRTGHRIATFTWGRTRKDAVRRAEDGLASDWPFWSGYRYELAAEPSGI